MRAADLKTVFFYDYNEGKENEREADQYFAREAERGRQQDKKAKRTLDDTRRMSGSSTASGSPAAPGSCGDCMV